MKRLLIALILTAAAQARAGLPVVAAADQQALLKSGDPRLAANKKLVYDFTRAVLSAGHMDQASTFLRDDYIQHNPNVETGLKGFLAAFGAAKPQPIPDRVDGLVSLTAEGDLVTMSFVSARRDNTGAIYTTTWFDMFRVQDGKIAEHWDCDTK